MPLGPTVTRREQSVGIVSDRAGLLARSADGFVFGPSAPEAASAATYWTAIDDERRSMSLEVGRWQRVRAAISLRSLRRTSPGRAREASGPEPAAVTDAAPLGAAGPVGATARVAGLVARLRSLADWRSRGAPD